jgi:site-specific DNA-methyltransferase (adenine-specific)
VLSLPEAHRFDRLVSSRKPFGLETKFKARTKKHSDADVMVYQNVGTGFAPRSSISAGSELIDAWKIFVGYAAPGTGNRDTYPHRVISTPFVAGPGTVSSETYLCIGPFQTKDESESALSYLGCRLTRLLIQLRKSSQHVTRGVYAFVPVQGWTRKWTDGDLYARYGLSDEEIAFVEKIVRPMGLESDLQGDVSVDDGYDE